DIEPAQGFAAEAATTATILASTHLGFALSTTQVASGSVIGTGIGRKGASVRWRTAGRIALGWVITIPAAALVGAGAAMVAGIGWWGILIDSVAAIVVFTAIFVLSRRTRVTSHDLALAPAQFVRPKQRGKAKKLANQPPGAQSPGAQSSGAQSSGAES
ncbi:MAG TPA: inorganic phosphate transporter, partial [Galbitalea sp.]|nr:inorganic phosphate transporter [Galbitalea sp.]